MLQALINKFWYRRHPMRWLFYPLAKIYQIVAAFRRGFLKRFFQQSVPVPVIVVGNLTVGGVGKTPLVIALAKACVSRGLRVGIVSRGYGSRLHHYPHQVTPTDSADKVGDEPLLLARRTNCPVVIAPKRMQAVQYLIEKHGSQLIISDDGLQHYTMGRTIEIAVIDGMRGLGNGLCLPAGPMRESVRRLNSVDFIVVNGGEWNQAHRMDLIPGAITPLATSERLLSAPDLSESIAAVAAIGNPQRFYDTLTGLGIKYRPYTFPDHHQFKPEDLQVNEKIILMTEKDGVKCQPFAMDNAFVLPVEAKISEKFWEAFWKHKGLVGYV